MGPDDDDDAAYQSIVRWYEGDTVDIRDVLEAIAVSGLDVKSELIAEAAAEALGAGLSIDEIASALGSSAADVKKLLTGAP